LFEVDISINEKVYDKNIIKSFENVVQEGILVKIGIFKKLPYCRGGLDFSKGKVNICGSKLFV